MSKTVYKPAAAHGGHLIHAVPVRESDPTKCGSKALCGKDANQSRRQVWKIYLNQGVTCRDCLIEMAKRGKKNFIKFDEATND